MVVRTVQELYSGMHQDLIAPHLQALGFTGAAGSYVVRSRVKDYGAIQFSRFGQYTTQERTVFVVSAGFRSRYRAQLLKLAGLPVRAPRRHFDWDYSRELHSFAPPGADGWVFLELTVGDDAAVVAAEIIRRIERPVEMVLDGLTAQGFLRQVDIWGDRWNEPVEAILAELELGRVDGALDRIAYRAAKERNQNGVQPNSGPVWEAAVVEPFVHLYGQRPERHPDFEARVTNHLRTIEAPRTN